MESKIIDYLKKNKVLTLATSVNDIPYCANCFYAFDEIDKTLIFLSDNNTAAHMVKRRMFHQGRDFLE